MAAWPRKVGCSFDDTSLTDAGLRNLANAQASGSMGLPRTPITGEGFDAFAGKRIGTLVLERCQLTPAGWQAVARIGPTGAWFLTSTNLDDTALKEIRARHPDIDKLDVSVTAITDASLEGLSTHAKLRWISLEKTNVSDTGLAHLAPCKTLTGVNVKKTKVTPAGVMALQQALPDCKIQWDDPARLKTQ